MAAVLNHTTRSTVTRDLRHLFLSINTRRRKTLKRQSPKTVEGMLGRETETKTKDRIMRWNIVPGDFVRARGDPKTEVGMQEVRAVNKYANMVFVKGPGAKPDGSARSIPYSACQLWIGDYDIPPSVDNPGGIQPVFAKRIVSTASKYNPRKAIFQWKRYAVATIPRLWPLGVNKKTLIPWPKPTEKIRLPPATLLDTKQVAAQAVTFSPFLPGAVPERVEHEYISALFSATATGVDTSRHPIENFVVGELINVHSRARRQKRWQARLAAIKESKPEFIRAELENLEGRRVQDAKKEGEIRWKLAVRRFLMRTRHNRWVRRGGLAKVEMRKERRTKKEKRRRNALRNLQLTPAPNQYIPPSA